ncbi:MAG: T9SS type A sorting domain-containing protein [Bacteroidales bacterium]|nr:T9SS type A sorting domain-containing protein [Bacteroidales bacterium]
MCRLILILTIVVATCCMANATSSWEHTVASAKMERLDVAQPEIRVSEGYVYVSTSRTITVKVFSILGQLISQETIQPGISRFRLPSRGVYILKVGDITKRITI